MLEICTSSPLVQRSPVTALEKRSPTLTAHEWHHRLGQSRAVCGDVVLFECLRSINSNWLCVKAHLHGAMHRATRMHSHAYDWSLDLFSSSLFVPLATTGWTNGTRWQLRRAIKHWSGDQKSSTHERSAVHCPMRRAIKLSRLHGAIWSLSIGRSIARCIAPCKWGLRGPTHF